MQWKSFIEIKQDSIEGTRKRVGATQSSQLVWSLLLRRANTERKVLTLLTSTQQSLSLLMGSEGCRCLSWKRCLCSRRQGGWRPQHSPMRPCCCGEPRRVSACRVSRTRQHATPVGLDPSLPCPSLL